MARFYGSVQGERSEATRMGHRGITAHPRGWDTGIAVEGFADAADVDTFTVTVTGGSNGYARRVTLGTVQRIADGSLRVQLGEEVGGGTYTVS